jgi:hypothetical protein
MKIIINTINIYNIHDITYNISSNNFKSRNGKMDDTDLSEFPTPIMMNDNVNHPLIARLEARILASEQEKQELLEELNNENK